MQADIFRAGLIGFCCFASSVVQAEVINFDDVSPDTTGSPLGSAYHDFDWKNFDGLDAVTYYKNPSGYLNGLVSGSNVAFNNFGTEASIAKHGGGYFSVQSAYMTAAWSNGLSVTVDGYLKNKLVDQITVTLSATGPTLVNFDFANVDMVTFDSSGGTNAGFGASGNQFAMDNLSLSTWPSAPAPTASLPILVALAFRGRRLYKKNKNTATP